MNVLPCDNKTIETQFLSWDEIQKNEGIYQPTNSDFLTARLIVVMFLNTRIVLFYHGNKLEPAQDFVWKDRQFLKTAEQVYFEVR